MHTRYRIMIAVLLFAFAAGAIMYWLKSETAMPLALTPHENAVGETAGHVKTKNADSAKKILDITTPQQQMDDIVDCAALLAVHESATKGELQADSVTLDLISYALGKAQELALQAGLNKSAAKALYDQKTVSYFLEYAADLDAAVSKNRSKVTVCEKQLQEYEPNAQIESTINQARAMAREAGQP